jgi:UDP-N-acetylglucosamine 1-carboxyvinyltransferase
MGEFHVRGGHSLTGALRIGGAKNAVLPILASTLLSGGKSTVQNCPLIADTAVTIDILEALGCKVTRDKSTITVDSSTAFGNSLPDAPVQKMRSSIIFLGAALGRFKEARICYPGGCDLGLRPIDLHLKSLRALGAEITEEHGFITCTARRLLGTEINLDFPSVGATENIMIAAATAEGTTVITNAAREPEISDLAGFLNSMGADITGTGTGKVVITGVNRLHETEYRIMPDRIVAGTYLAAAAITGGQLELTDIVTEHLEPILSKFEEMGNEIQKARTTVRLTAPARLKPIAHMRTLPHPGFPTDMQAQIMALTALADGTSVITETVFESRTKHIPELVRMGADIICPPDGRTSIVKGVTRLEGATVAANDLRGGAALILAGLAADGKTTVTNASHILRGYEGIEKQLVMLGADIKYVES